MELGGTGKESSQAAGWWWLDEKACGGGCWMLGRRALKKEGGGDACEWSCGCHGCRGRGGTVLCSCSAPPRRLEAEGGGGGARGENVKKGPFANMLPGGNFDADGHSGL